MKLISWAQGILSSPRQFLLCLFFISLAALGMALIAQYMFGLAPCNLCMIQRFPYGFVAVLGFAGYMLSGSYPKSAPWFCGAAALAYFANAVIAAYHTGVERHWWKSFLEGCSVPDLGTNVDELLEKIQAAPVARCDEIPWADPIFGLSMANYNIVFCAGLGILCVIVLLNTRTSR